MRMECLGWAKGFQEMWSQPEPVSSWSVCAILYSSSSYSILILRHPLVEDYGKHLLSLEIGGCGLGFVNLCFRTRQHILVNQ